MSIIHDALKKIQGQTPKADEKTTGYIYTTPSEPTKQAEPQVAATGQKQPMQNKIKSVLALLCAFAITLGALIFLYKQLHAYFPTVKRLAESSFYKLIHKKEHADLKPEAPPPLPPLAKITVNPVTTRANPIGVPSPPANPSHPPAPPNPSAIADTPKPPAPETLDVHGVMSNGKNNLVLINDQVYQEGDDVDGVKIVKINLDFITVIINGKEEKIRVKN